MPEARDPITLYGIPNCDQVKKARRWLDAANLPYRFHDFRRDGLTASRVQAWLKKHPWTSLVNTRGTTWRGLPAGQRPHDADGALAAVLAAPTLIRRPVVEVGDQVLVGFSEAQFLAVFQGR